MSRSVRVMFQLYSSRTTIGLNMRSIIILVVAAYGLAVLINAQTPTTARPGCVNGTQFTCNDGTCLPINWKCDGEADCPDGSDEFPALCPCSPNQYACDDGQCIAGNGRCNKLIECRDKSDEYMCPCPGPEDEYFRCNDHGACVDLELVCDRACDCVDCEDEEATDTCPGN